MSTSRVYGTNCIYVAFDILLQNMYVTTINLKTDIMVDAITYIISVHI